MNYGLLNFCRLSITIVANRLQWLFHFRLGCAFILKWLQGPLDRSGMSTGINNNNYIKKAVFTPMMIIYMSSSERSLFHKHLKVPSSYLIKKKVRFSAASDSPPVLYWGSKTITMPLCYQSQAGAPARRDMWFTCQIEVEVWELLGSGLFSVSRCPFRAKQERQVPIISQECHNRKVGLESAGDQTVV